MAAGDTLASAQAKRAAEGPWGDTTPAKCVLLSSSSPRQGSNVGEGAMSTSLSTSIREGARESGTSATQAPPLSDRKEYREEFTKEWFAAALAGRGKKYVCTAAKSAEKVALMGASG